MSRLTPPACPEAVVRDRQLRVDLRPPAILSPITALLSKDRLLTIPSPRPGGVSSADDSNAPRREDCCGALLSFVLPIAGEYVGHLQMSEAM